MTDTLDQEYMIIRQMQVANFNMMKKLFPTCKLSRHTSLTQTFDNLIKHEFYYYFETNWDEELLSFLRSATKKFYRVALVLPNYLLEYPLDKKVRILKCHVDQEREVLLEEVV